jgi:CDGSH-type Zn-finger protein
MGIGPHQADAPELACQKRPSTQMIMQGNHNVERKKAWPARQQFRCGFSSSKSFCDATAAVSRHTAIESCMTPQ